jgi:hypothetical protein
MFVPTCCSHPSPSCPSGSPLSSPPPSLCRCSSPLSGAIPHTVPPAAGPAQITYTPPPRPRASLPTPSFPRLPPHPTPVWNLPPPPPPPSSPPSSALPTSPSHVRVTNVSATVINPPPPLPQLFYLLQRPASSGGAACALVDDAVGWMGFCHTGTVEPWSGFTAQVNTSLKLPVATGSVLMLRAGVDRLEGRKVK